MLFHVGRLLDGGWMESFPSGDPSSSGPSNRGSAPLGESHLQAAGSSELPGVNGVQLASLARSCGTSQGPLLSSSSSLRLFLDPVVVMISGS